MPPIVGKLQIQILVLFISILFFSTIDGNNHTGKNITVQSILSNEVAFMKSAIQSVNETRVKNVLQDVVHVIEEEATKLGNKSLSTFASFTKAANQTGSGLGYRFWEIHQKIFNNSKLTDSERSMVVKILHSAASKADEKLPAPLSSYINSTEVLLEEERALGEPDILI